MKISTLLYSVKQFIVTFFVFFSMMLTPVKEVDIKYTAENADELMMSFSVVSDIHVETTNPETYKNLYKLLYGIKAYENNDAVVYLGDNVMNGQFLENVLFYSAIKKL